MGRIRGIGVSMGVGNSSQLSMQQQAYSSLVWELENVINNTIIYNINSNAKAMNEEYPITKTGYFGKKGTSNKKRVIYTDNPISESNNFFNNISKGYYSKTIHGNATIVHLPDETVITYRVITKTSKSGNSPAVDININNSKANPKIKRQRIHFEKERK